MYIVAAPKSVLQWKMLVGRRLDIDYRINGGLTAAYSFAFAQIKTGKGVGGMVCLILSCVCFFSFRQPEKQPALKTK